MQITLPGQASKVWHHQVGDLLNQADRRSHL